MKRYRVSVCKGPDCKSRGSDKVFAAFRELLAPPGAGARSELYRGGCYGLCHLGPNVVVREDIRPRDPLSREDFQLMGWDDEAYYSAMTPERAARVVSEHLSGDRVAADLLGDPSKEPPKDPKPK